MNYGSGKRGTSPGGGGRWGKKPVTGGQWVKFLGAKGTGSERVVLWGEGKPGGTTKHATRWEMRNDIVGTNHCHPVQKRAQKHPQQKSGRIQTQTPACLAARLWGQRYRPTTIAKANSESKGNIPSWTSKWKLAMQGVIVSREKIPCVVRMSLSFQ